MDRQHKIFISYRQNDSSDTVNYLHDVLTRRFGPENVFMDIRSLKGGDELAEVIKSKIRESDVVLVIIGNSWVSSIKQRQAEGKIDHVRLEVATALKARPSVRVIPVTVQEASFPAESDLPDDMHSLVGLRGNILSVRWWRLDVEELMDHIKTSSGIAGALEGQKTETQTHPHKQRRSTVEVSILGGALAGMITGTVVGIAYTVTERVSWSRVAIVTVYGLVAGFLVSALINAGIEKSPRVIGNPIGRKFVGAVLGGALGGLIAGLIAGFLFSLFPNDELVHAGWVVAAVALSSFFITAGILLPDLKQDWVERSIVFVGIAVVVAIIAFVVAWLLIKKFSGLGSLVTDSPYSLGVLIFGSLYGAMAGAQVGLALVVYEIRSRMRLRQGSGKVVVQADDGDE